MFTLFIFLQLLLMTYKVSGYDSLTLCETESTRITCPGFIKILKVFYGRSDLQVCASDFGNVTDCKSPTAEALVKRNCNGRDTCWLGAIPSVFDDPCPGIFKYLQVAYKCVPSAEYLITNTESNNLLENINKDMVNMQATVTKLQTELKLEKEKIKKLEAHSTGTSVAFFAGLGTSIVNPDVGSTIIFDQVSTNTGKAYDGATGIFTAPVSGIYYFSVEASSRYSSTYSKLLHLLLQQNKEKTFGYVFLDHNTSKWLKNIASASINLRKGDEVSVQVRGTQSSPTLNGNSGTSLHTTFTGFLVSKFDSE